MTQVRLLAFAAFLALTALGLLWTEQGGTGVRAAVFRVTPAGNGQFMSGTSLAVTVVAEDDRGALVITASGATEPKISVPVTGCTNLSNIFFCTGTVTGNDTASVTIDTAKLDLDEIVTELRVTLTLTATCAVNTPLSLVASQQDEFQHQVSVAASPEIICTVPAPALTFTSAVNPPVVGCGGRAAVVFNPMLGQGAQTLYFAATTGTVAPASVAFIGSSAGAVSTFFTAPLAPVASSATITLQTAAGVVLGSARVTTNCSGAVTATSVPTVVNTAAPLATPVVLRPTPPPTLPQAAAQPAALTPAVISPPNTGDGGLLLACAGPE